MTRLLGKWLFRVALKPVLRLVGPLLFSKLYLRGRHFDGDAQAGWIWLWRAIWVQKLLGFNRSVPFPINPTSKVYRVDRLEFHPDDLNNFQSPGCYFQNFSARITIGQGTYIAPNVGIITSNHDPCDPSRHLRGLDVVIGRKCWIGMNAVVLPGVVLGDRTIVGAGAVVTKSFPDGNCVIAGVPAVVIRTLDCGEVAGGTHDTQSR